ncbi:hypothetical protein BG015_001486 [Linnemannia schmuckeri]|uniref:Uncharacterized protein n=1 Tax=Linnemannia schmuckeri TaxID=64567 RepID=A0A9P5VDZ5_9FUNG|nr:hypothetical protein BG015_001486 [Linnemannia schmuckeri]
MSGKKVAIAQGGMRGEAKKTKVVFKNVLDTPFNIQCMVKPIRDYHNARPKQDIKSDKKQKKSTSKEPAGSASSKPSTALATLTDTSSAIASESNTRSTAVSTAPAILKSTILGINAITKAMERSIQDLAAHPPPAAIILCKGDLIPSHLYAHLGPMIAMLPGVLLFPLLKGSERRLSEALGLPAVGALAIQSTEGSREAEDLIMILKGMVEPMTASWLPKVTPKPVAKDKTSKQLAATKPTSATASEAGAGTTSSTVSASAPESGKATEATKAVSKPAEFIATNIKTIKTTMPIVVKTPKPAKPNSSDSNNSSNSSKSREQGQQQQQQKQQQKQQQNQNQNRNQSQNPKQKHQQGKNKKPPVDNLDSDRGQGKKAKSS